MRRMKIRAVPNIGSGGNLQRVNLPRTKPPDGDSTTQPVTEPSTEKNCTHETRTLPVQSAAGAASKSETVGNIEKERKTTITIELDSCDDKSAEVEIEGYKPDRPTCKASDNINVSKNYNRDKSCSDVEILPKLPSKKITEPLLSEVDDEVQEVAISESIQCLGAYKRQQSPHMSSSKDPSAISRSIEITLDNQNEGPALPIDTAKNSVSDTSKSSLMSPKHIASTSSPARDVDCITDNTSKGKSDNMGSRNEEVVIDDDKVMHSEDGTKVVTSGNMGSRNEEVVIDDDKVMNSEDGKKVVTSGNMGSRNEEVVIDDDKVMCSEDGKKVVTSGNMGSRNKEVVIGDDKVMCSEDGKKVVTSGNMGSRNEEVVIDDDKVMRSEDGKKVVTSGSDKVFVNRGKSVEKSIVGMGTLTRRPKIRAKPSISSNFGKKPVSHNRKEVNLQVTPIVNSCTEDVILEEGNGKKDDLTSKIQDVTLIEDRNEAIIPASQNLVAKSREITLDDSNETKLVSNKEVLIVNDEENNRSPRVLHGTSFIKSALGKGEKSVSSALDTSHEKSSPNTVHSHTEDVILEKVGCGNDHSLGKTKQATSIKDRSEIKIPVEKSQEITLDDGNETKSVGSKEVITIKGEENEGNLRFHSGTLLEKSALDKEKKNMSSALIHEKSSPNAVGPIIRRRKISAMPSVLKSLGRKGVVDSSKISEMKKEIHQDKEVSCLTLDESSREIGTSEIEGKKTKQVHENESSVKEIKEIIQEDSCSALSSVPVENELDSQRCTEDTTSIPPSKLSESDVKGNVSRITPEKSSPGQVRTTKSEVKVTGVAINSMRRSRIRATPSLFPKRKTPQVDAQDDLVAARKEKEVLHSVNNQPQARLLAENVSDEKGEDNENNTYSCQAVPDDVNSQTQARILSEKISDEKSSENKIEKNTDHCEAVVDGKCNSKDATESLESVCKSSLVKKRQFTDGGDTKTKKVTPHSRKKLDIRELVSDDSGGNKENTSKCLSGKAVKRERNIKVPTNSKSKSKLLQLDSEEKKLAIKSERKLNASDNSDSESEESLQKKVFRERKEKFRKKLTQSQGNIERGQMTMFDLIFWNPIKNPMPGRTDIDKKKDNLGTAVEGDDAASDVLEEQMVDDIGLESKSVAEESRPNSPGSAKDEVQISNEDGSSSKSDQLAVEKCEEESENKDEKSDEESVRDVFAPQVKIGPNGQIILDEQSIKIQTTAAKNRDEILSKAEVVEESNDTAHYGKWNKKRRRSCEWTMKETARFYKALSTVGTDFSLMETLFNWRSRAELKTKFKKEERTNRELVDIALKDCTQFDFTPFDEESDYDPEEDRKASRIAERAEAKRKRLEMKQLQKEEEKLQKKLLVKENKKKIKQRQVVMRKMKNEIESKKKAKRKAKTDQSNGVTDRCSDSSDSDAGSEPVTSRLKVTDQDPVTDLPRKKRSLKSSLKNSDQDPVADLPKKRRVLKKQRPKIRKSSSPLEISEVTVTMETVKSQKTEHTVPDVTGCERTVCEDVSILESAGLDDQRNLDQHNPDIATASISSEPMNENLAHKSSSSEIKSSIGSSQISVISSPPVAFPGSDSISGDSEMWEISLSAVKVDEDGTRSVSIPTENGEKVVPVPHVPPGTSSVLVVATKAVDTPGGFIYHVYTISPMSQE